MMDNGQTGPLPYIDQIVSSLAQANVAIPVILGTIRIVRELWRQHHPDPNDDIPDDVLITRMGDTFRALGQQADAEIAAAQAQIDAENQS